MLFSISCISCTSSYFSTILSSFFITFSATSFIITISSRDVLFTLSLLLLLLSSSTDGDDDCDVVVDEEDEDDDGEKRARDKVNLGRNQLLRNKALKKAFPTTSRSVLGGPKVNIDKAASTADQAAKASRSSKASSSRSKKSEPSSPGKPTKVGKTSEIDYKERARKGKISFEFSKAELIDVVKSISELTQKNFIIPEKLKSQKKRETDLTSDMSRMRATM